jgi:hypothetical protein
MSPAPWHFQARSKAASSSTRLQKGSGPLNDRVHEALRMHFKRNETILERFKSEWVFPSKRPKTKTGHITHHARIQKPCSLCKSKT